MNTRDLLDQKAQKLAEARALNTLAETENRDFTPEEQTKWDGLQGDIKSLDNRIERARSLPVAEPVQPETRQAPAFLKNERGTNFPGALKAWLRDGDAGGVKDILVRDSGMEGIELRASNNTDMNIGTDADGGYTVPTGFYNQIIARRSEMSLPDRLGVRRIPGIGTTIDIPYDNEADGEFVSTAEGTDFDQDAPAIGKHQMTLAKYTKYITLSDELMQDTGVNLMGFLSDWVARGQAKTMNSLLLTEVGTNGTAFKTTAASTTLAFGELEDVAINDYVADYLDDSQSVGWVMRPSTFNAVRKIQSASPRMYGTADNVITSNGTLRRGLLEYPVLFSNKAAAIASTAKVAYFGNWNYVGWREGSITILRDPYSAAGTGQLKLWMYFRTVFKVLQGYAIGYLKMKT